MTELHEQDAQSPLAGRRDAAAVLGTRGWTVRKATGRNDHAGQGTAASLSDTVRLFALLGAGIADAVAVSWTDKFTTHYWRPGDAIRQASNDGNLATEEDAS